MEMPDQAKARRCDLRSWLWPAACVAYVAVILAAYLFLLTSNAVYLGWNDGLHFLQHPRMWDRLWLTMWTATVATLFSMLVGIPVGYALSRFRFPVPYLMSTLIDLPVMVPAAAVGAFLFGFVRTFPIREISAATGVQLAHNAQGVIFVQFVVTVAFCARLMKAAFGAVNPRFEAVSRALGATLPRTFLRVTLPLAKRGILASLFVVWARAAAEWEALMLFVGGTTGQTDVMPFAVYLDWNGGMMGWCVSISLVCVVMAMTAMGAMRIIGGKSYVW
jgi:ABC-type sulfate transport system permease component